MAETRLTHDEILTKLQQMVQGAVFAACSRQLKTIEIRRETAELYAYCGHYYPAADLAAMLAREPDLTYFGISSRQ